MQMGRLRLKRARWLLWVFAGLVGACASRLPPPPTASELAPTDRIAAGDVVEVRVLGEKEMSGMYRVDAEGAIPFPFLGALEVRGLTAAQVADLLRRELIERGYMVDPQMAVFLQETSRRATLLGAVAKPGTIAVGGGLTLLEAVSQAGGFTALASKDGTLVTRRVSSRTQRFRVEVSRIVRGELPDVPLQAGDIVYVPERAF